jgi:hypothetical protein
MYTMFTELAPPLSSGFGFHIDRQVYYYFVLVGAVGIENRTLKKDDQMLPQEMA